MDIDRFIERQSRLRELSDVYDRTHGTHDVWSVIREAYELMLPIILERKGRCSPYFFDWQMTPIEKLAWQDIRGTGMRLFPQVPVGRYFIDFADPCKRIGVELDGKDFHSEAKDRPRDEWLWSQGWRIFRIPGRMVFAAPKSAFHEDWTHEYREDRDRFLFELKEWANSWSEGIFWALRYFYYTDEERRDPMFASAAQSSLRSNRHVQFPLWLTLEDEERNEGLD